jgi:hypothetical protein
MQNFCPTFAGVTSKPLDKPRERRRILGRDSCNESRLPMSGDCGDRAISS